MSLKLKRASSESPSDWLAHSSIHNAVCELILDNDRGLLDNYRRINVVAKSDKTRPIRAPVLRNHRS